VRGDGRNKQPLPFDVRALSIIRIVKAGHIGENSLPGSASSAWRWTKHTNTFIRKERSHADSDEI
jgi:hypothetical protein